MTDTTLERLADTLWVSAAPLAMLGVQVGTRMTLVRLSDRSLWLHSPVAISATLKTQVDALGPVSWIVAPNRFHHLYAGEAATAWPDAKLVGEPGLANKRKDLRFDALLDETGSSPWAPDIESQFVGGTLLHETIFFHAASRTLITSDIAENCLTGEDLLTRIYARLGGVSDRFAVPLLLRLCYRDKARGARDIRRVLEWDFDRIILAHGKVLESGGKAALLESYRWLLGKAA
jgi:hypothetical protein